MSSSDANASYPDKYSKRAFSVGIRTEKALTENAFSRSYTVTYNYNGADGNNTPANAEFTWYASPNKIVYTDTEYVETMGEDAMSVLYPPMDDFAALYNEYAYRNLDQETLDYINTLWENVKIN